MDKVAQFTSTLFASRTQAHIFHLQTTSYAQHIALGAYYDGIIPLVDGLVELIQGRYGIVRGYISPAAFKEDDSTVSYFEALLKYVDLKRDELPQDSNIQNALDEIVDLISSTLYKLKYLH
jgi:hypothetical protein